MVSASGSSASRMVMSMFLLRLGGSGRPGERLKLIPVPALRKTWRHIGGAMKRLAAYVFLTLVIATALYERHPAGQVNVVKELAPGVYFHQGDIEGKGHCNNGWVVFND